MQAHGAAAAWQAVCDYDPSRRVSLHAFVSQRILASALTRYRQEWVFALHCLFEVEADRPGRAETSFRAGDTEGMGWALAHLPESDQWLIQHLFWQEETEAEVGATLGISHQAVSKHKRAILQELRGWLDESEEI